MNALHFEYPPRELHPLFGELAKHRIGINHVEFNGKNLFTKDPELKPAGLIIWQATFRIITAHINKAPEVAEGHF